MLVPKDIHQLSVQEVACRFVIELAETTSDRRCVTVSNPSLYHASSVLLPAMSRPCLCRFDNIEKGPVGSDDASRTVTNLCGYIFRMEDEVFKSYEKKRIIGFLPILMIPSIP